MSERTQARLRAAVVAVAPVVVLIGFLYHPYVGDLTDRAAVADEVAADTTRWAWSHLIAAAGLALTLLLAVSVRSYLRVAGEQTWSFVAIPLLVIGGVMFAALTGVEIGMAAAVEGTAQGEAFADAAEPWMTPLILGGAVVFGLGWLSLATAIYRSEVLSRELTWVVVAALVVLTVALFIPTGWKFYVIGVASVVSAWPLAYQMWAATTTAPMAAEPPSRP